MYCHFGSRFALVEAAIVHEKVQLRVVERNGLANSFFEEAIYHESLDLLQQKLRGSL